MQSWQAAAVLQVAQEERPALLALLLLALLQLALLLLLPLQQRLPGSASASAAGQHFSSAAA
jgi:hypothetical protein